MKKMNEKRVAAVFLIALLSALCFTACGRKEAKQEVGNKTKNQKTQSEENEKYAHLIERFCEVMNVEKKDLNLIFNFATEYGNVCYDIGVKGHEDLAGTYIFTEYDSEITIAKKVTSKEKEERRLEEKLGYNQCYAELYEIIYNSGIEKSREETREKQLTQVLEIDSSHVKKYEEERLGTGDIWECWSGFINQDNHFMVSYYGDTSGWTQGVFQNGKWTMKQLTVLGGGYEYYYCSTFEDDTLWYFNDDEEKLEVTDTNGHVICDMKLNQWCEKNDMASGVVKSITKLPGKQAIFNCLPDYREENKYQAFVVDLKTGEVVKKFDRSIYGTYSAGKIYCFDSSINVMEIVNLETGETEELLDLSNIHASTEDSIEYVIFSDQMQSFCEVEFGKGDYPIRYCVNDGELYFSYFSGVYYYNKEEKKLEQIVDGKKQELFREMQGSIAVDKGGEHIYMLGFIGGGDDEGACDFLYMTREK